MWFMSDLAEKFLFSLGVNISYCKPTQEILCAWHVDRACRKKIEQLSDTQLKLTTYQI